MANSDSAAVHGACVYCEGSICHECGACPCGGCECPYCPQCGQALTAAEILAIRQTEEAHGFDCDDWLCNSCEEQLLVANATALMEG